MYDWSLLEQDVPFGWSWDSPQQEEIDTFLYFIREKEGRVKIGVSREPKKRLRELQVGNSQELELLGTRLGTWEDEQKIHKLFSAHHIRGEWFEESLPLMALIAELTQ